MSTFVVKAVPAAAGLSVSCLILVAATLVQDPRVFDGKAVHERRSVLFDGARILYADFAAPSRRAPLGRHRGNRAQWYQWDSLLY